jgi:hypothetical protein
MIILGGLGVQQAKVDALQNIPAPVDVPRLCVFFVATLASFSPLSSIAFQL